MAQSSVYSWRCTPADSQVQTNNTVFSLRRDGGQNRGDGGPTVVPTVVALVLVAAVVTEYSTPRYYILGF